MEQWHSPHRGLQRFFFFCMHDPNCAACTLALGASPDGILTFFFACLCVCSAGELSAEELESIMQIVANPRAYKIPDWFLNRQKDIKDGKFSQVRG